MDAWERKAKERADFTRGVTVSDDLVVEAAAWDRAVVVKIKKYDGDDYDESTARWITRAGTVHTMSELAQAILDACEYVKAQNPKWAK